MLATSVAPHIKMILNLFQLGGKTENILQLPRGLVLKKSVVY